MIITLLASVYITFLCWCWGSMLIRLMARSSGVTNSLHFSIVCFTGFAAITITGAMLSLFLPLGTWMIQLVLLLPAVLMIKRIRKPVYDRSLHPVLLILLIACTSGMLAMSVWFIIHPDTLGYHAQTIKWIEEYSAVPGLVNLNTRYGYQGLWFVSCALFSFKFIGTQAITFINTTILIWYILFMIDRINHHFRNGGSQYRGFLWLALFSYTLWNYTHVRLTATSASPDFIATISVLLVFYILYQKEPGTRTMNNLLVILLSAFAFTLKLSTIPLILVAVYALIDLFRSKMHKHAALSVLIGVMILTPFITRNIISSGWALFPSTIPDIVKVDWQLNSKRTALEKDYITAYARTQSNDNSEEIAQVIKMSYREWVPVWFSQRSLSDKILIFAFLLSVIYGFVRIKRLMDQKELLVIFLTSVLGSIFWFTQAPDPRFGAGFLLAAPCIILASYFNFSNSKIGIRFLFAAITLLIMIVTSYTIYRFIDFFSVKQLLFPSGIENKQYTSVNCQGFQFYLPFPNEPCADQPLPCVYDDCRSFELRGNKIKNGFRAK